MKIVSIDVGIKNCSFCVLSNAYNELSVEHWEIINLMELDKDISPRIECMCFTHSGKKRKKCAKPAIYQKGTGENEPIQYFCKVHAKKDKMFENKELSISALNKTLIKDLVLLLKKYNIPINDCKKRTEFIDLLVCYQKTHGLSLIVSPVKQNKCATVELQILGQNIMTYFDALNIQNVSHIIIENQIGPLATKMKTVQGMLMQYFIMRYKNINIEFISATNKLKNYATYRPDINKVSLQTYAFRKKLSVEICFQIIKSSELLSTWTDYFESCKKKDDLSDCFLQGLWFIQVVS